MFGLTLSLIFAVYIALSCSHKVVYFDTPFKDCKDLCCSRKSCQSFDVLLPSLECYLNEKVNSSAINTNLNRTHMKEHRALRGSCRDWEENPDGCPFSLKFEAILTPSSGKTTEQHGNVTKKETTTYTPGHATNETTKAVQSPVLCPRNFIHDSKSSTCWQIVSTPLLRHKAEKYCASSTTGGYLAVLDTSDKYEFVKSLLSTSYHMACVHIGGEKLNSSSYIWLNKVLVGNRRWCPGQPSRHIDENLLSLWPEKGYCFDDMAVMSKCDFVCEGHR